MIYSSQYQVNQAVAARDSARAAFLDSERLKYKRDEIVTVDKAKTRILEQLATIRLIGKYEYNPDKNRNAQLADSLASMLAGAGVRSILDIGKGFDSAIVGKWTGDVGNAEVGARGDITVSTNGTFFYDRSRGVPLKFLNDIADEYPAGDPEFAIIDYDCDRNIVYLHFTNDGYPIFWMRSLDRCGSFWGGLLEGLKAMGPVVGVALMVFFPAAAASMGSAVLGAGTAAAYPALASAVGNAVISTALNGGDVKAGVIGAASGYLGTAAGATVQAATDSGALAAASQAAVQSLARGVRGGDLSASIAQSLAMYGVAQIQPVPSSPVDSGANMIGFSDARFDYYNTPDTSPALSFTNDTYDPGLQNFGDVTGFNPISSFDPFGTSAPLSFDLTSAASASNVWGVNFNLPGGASAQPAPAAQGGAQGATGWDVALAALRVLPVFAGKTIPPPTVAPRTVTGAVDPRTLPVGQPAQMPDGRIIVNNGNGSYSVIDGTGRATTTPMPGSAASPSSLGVSGGTLTLIAGGAALFFMLKK